MFIKKIFMVAFLVVFLSVTGNQALSRDLTLEQAVDMAFGNNYD